MVYYRYNNDNTHLKKLEEEFINIHPTAPTRAAQVRNETLKELKNILISYMNLYKEFIKQKHNNINLPILEHYKFLEKIRFEDIQKEINFMYYMHNVFL